MSRTSPTDQTIGRLIDGRYRVRSRIARGGMATVYLATDLRLDRMVAVKIMHHHLADDEQFTERFIQEARSAARLAHPNVVNVFDQGQDGDSVYLVMEYLPGITLRDLLQQHPALTAEQALDIAEAVLAGLSAAHRAGIVHRDLKPENVLLADDGRIKIGDFGLARAASTQTATGKALLGTIAYLSPELLTRGVADARSDIYAVGIMLYEMLTGEQPFKGEQPMQIAYQHANDSVPPPSTANPRVPAELDELVLWATARDPQQRPADARMMLDQLRDTARSLETALPGTTGPQRTMLLPVKRGNDGEQQTQVLDRTSTQETRALPAGAPDSAARLAERAGQRRTRGWWWFAAVVLLAGIAGGAGWFFGSGPGAQLRLPAGLAGMTENAARAELTELGVLVADATAGTTHPTIESGRVVDTDPGIGSTVNRGSEVTLVLSLGPQSLPLPELIGLDEAAAVDAIEAAGFTHAGSSGVFTADAAAGRVVDALDAAGASLRDTAEYPEQRPITLVVSRGAVPDVSGLTVEQAQLRLEEVELVGVPGDRNEHHDDIPAGHVLRGVPAEEGPVAPGDRIVLIRSLGVEQVSVPDVTGGTLDEAIRELESLGFRVSYNPVFAPFGWAQVTGTDPAAGSTVDKGSTVTLFLRLIG